LEAPLRSLPSDVGQAGGCRCNGREPNGRASTIPAEARGAKGGGLRGLVSAALDAVVHGLTLSRVGGYRERMQPDEPGVPGRSAQTDDPEEVSPDYIHVKRILEQMLANLPAWQPGAGVDGAIDRTGFPTPPPLGKITGIPRPGASFSDSECQAGVQD